MLISFGLGSARFVLRGRIRSYTRAIFGIYLDWIAAGFSHSNALQPETLHTWLDLAIVRFL